LLSHHFSWLNWTSRTTWIRLSKQQTGLPRPYVPGERAVTSDACPDRLTWRQHWWRPWENGRFNQEQLAYHRDLILVKLYFWFKRGRIWENHGKSSINGLQLGHFPCLSISQYISMDRFAGLLVAITSSKLAELVKNHLGRSGWQWETSTW